MPVQGAADPPRGAVPSLFPLMNSEGKSYKNRLIYKLTPTAPNGFTNNVILLRETSGEMERAIVLILPLFPGRTETTAGDVRPLNKMAINRQRKRAHGSQTRAFVSLLHSDSRRGEHRSWVSDLKQIPGGSPLSAYFTVHVSKSWYIWQTSLKPKRHNLPALKWWCGQSRAGAGGGRLGAAETPGRHHTSAGTQAVGAWMGFCHEWITTRNVWWGEDESFTRLSLLIPCVHWGWAGLGWGGWNKQISQRKRRRTESLFFRLREGWDVDKACNWECSAKLIWQAKVYGVSSLLGTRVKCPFPSLPSEEISHPQDLCYRGRGRSRVRSHCFVVIGVLTKKGFKYKSRQKWNWINITHSGSKRSSDSSWIHVLFLWVSCSVRLASEE